MIRSLSRPWTAAILAVFVLFVSACSSKTENAPQATSSQTASPSASGAVDSAPSSSSEPSASPEAAQPAKGFLWKIEGGAHPGYLVGTIHIADKKMYPLDPQLERTLDEADFVALELDLTKADQKRTLELVNERAMLPEGTTLKDVVDEKDYERFQSILKKSLLAAAAPMFDQYEPWYAAMTLESLPAMRFMLTEGIDMHFAKQAHKEGKEVIELESLEAQLDIFDGLSEEMQQLYFHQTVSSSGKAMEGMQQLIEMWQAGNLDELETAHKQFEQEGLESMGKLFEEYNDALLLSRNVAMADKIDDFLQKGKDGTYLIAVGSLHMVGESGLVSLLEQKGYDVKFMQ